jgi:phospholipid-binding lipoprotein MlaA
VGLGGIFDVASSIDLPKHNEDFGQTLGYWGVPAGPYLVLPFFGPSNPRDTVGIIGDALLNPLTYVSFFGGSIGSAASLGASTVNVADKRASLIPAEKVLNEGSTGNRYDFLKSSYQQNRNYLINDGKVPDSDDPLELLNSDESANPIKTDNSVPPKGKKPVVQVLPIEVK